MPSFPPPGRRSSGQPEPRSRARRLGVASATALVLALAGAVSVPTAANATTYPTWADVQAAQANQAAKQAEVQVIQSTLQADQADAAAKSQAALVASEQKNQAEAALAAADQMASNLDAQAKTAAATAARAQERAGQLAANLYRDGAGNSVTSQIAASKDPNQLLYQLGTLSQLSTTWAGVMNDASVAANTATSLHDQAARAEAERSRLAGIAEQKSQAADAAVATANAAVATTQSHANTMYAQLAALQSVTAETARQYQIGVQVAAQVAAQQAAARKAAQEAAARRQQQQQQQQQAASPSGGGAPSTVGVVVNPAAAQAYAASAIGAYGWGSDQFTCLRELWTQESGWRADALNVSSGAYGIPQALPADKMATAGADWRTNQNTQIDWGLAYIKDAYGSPCAAWAHEMSQNPHWY